MPKGSDARGNVVGDGGHKNLLLFSNGLINSRRSYHGRRHRFESALRGNVQEQAAPPSGQRPPVFVLKNLIDLIAQKTTTKRTCAPIDTVQRHALHKFTNSPNTTKT